MTLDQYLTQENERRAKAKKPKLTDAEFGALVGISQPQVSRLRAGLSRPSWATIDAIMTATKGKVSANDWVQTEAAE
jgi:transcriptional regulator with XRE-family HTH domain